PQILMAFSLQLTNIINNAPPNILRRLIRIFFNEEERFPIRRNQKKWSEFYVAARTTYLVLSSAEARPPVAPGPSRHRNDRKDEGGHQAQQGYNGTYQSEYATGQQI